MIGNQSDNEEVYTMKLSTVKGMVVLFVGNVSTTVDIK